MEEAFASADIFILMVSSGYSSSVFAMYEARQAVGISLATGAKIFPVMIKDGPSPEVLRRYQFIDAREMSVEEIAGKIERIVKQ